MGSKCSHSEPHFCGLLKKNYYKVKQYSVCGKQKSMAECTATEIHRKSDDDFSRNTAALSLEFCQTPENMWHLKSPNKVKGDSFRSTVTESEVGTSSPHLSQ